MRPAAAAAALVCLAAATVHATDEAIGQVIDAIDVRGLERTKRTRPWIVERELPWRAGDAVSAEAWDLGLARLWNTGLFSHVDARIETRGAQRVAVVDVEERFTLNPLFRFSVGGGTYWWRVGLDEANVAGRYLELAAQYERFGAHSGGQAWWRAPNLGGTRTMALVQAERLARPRPGFTVFRALGRVEVAREITPLLVWDARADLFADRFDLPVDGAADLPPPSEGVLATASLKAGRLDTVRIRQQGATVELRAGPGASDQPGTPPWGVATLEAFAFALAGERWNFALRGEAGAMTPAERQDRFYVGGLDLVRGIPDNALRSTAFALVNLEARFTAYDSAWLALVPAAFVDGVVARSESGGPPATALTAGGGLRVLCPKLVAMGLRVDVAVPLSPAGAPNLSVGVYQFF